MRGASLQSQLVSRALSVTARPTFSVWSYTSRLGWPVGMLDAAATALPAIDGTQHQPVRLQNCDAEWIQGPGANAEHVVLYLHGGAFLCCGLRTHRRMVSRISAVSQSSVLAVDYRLLPHHTISDAISDGVDAYKWLLASGYSAENILVAGDSAGGYLAFEVPLAIAAAGLPGPAGIVALSPLTEMDPTRKLAHRNSRHCSMFPRRAVPALAKLSDRMDEQAMTTRGQLPRVCPVDANLTVLPPTLIQVGSHEMLYPDSALIAERLAAAGVPCELQVWDHQPHVFQVFADVIPEGHDAIAEIGRFIRSAWGALLTPVD
ncbi:alpha/beta hydrolase [Tomitella fengzijianii]